MKISVDNHIFWSNYIFIEQSIHDRIDAIRAEIDDNNRNCFDQALRDASDSAYETMQLNIAHVVDNWE